MPPTTCTLTGSYGSQPGVVTILPTSAVHSGSSLVVAATPITQEFTSGHFSLPGLVCTDNAGLTPSGWSYLVVVQAGSTLYAARYLLPIADAPTVDISALTPVEPAIPLSAVYAILAGTNTFTGASTTFTGDVFIDGELNLTSGPIIVSGPWSMSNQRLTNLANGVASSDAATVGQMPTALPPSGTAGGDLTGTYPSPTLGATSNVRSIVGSVRLDQMTQPNNPVNMGGQPLRNLAPGIYASDAATMSQLTGSLTASGDLTGTYPAPLLAATPHVNALIQANRLSDMSAPNAPVSMAGQRLTTLANGTSASDAATVSQLPGSASTSVQGLVRLAGDLAGTAASPVVARVNGVAVTGTPSTGQIPVATSSSTASWQSVSSSASRLVPTTVKTSNYTASAQDLVPCNPSGASFTVTLPTAPADGTQVGVKIVVAPGANTLALVAGGSDVFNVAGGSNTATLRLLGESRIVQYSAATSIWYVLADDLTLTALDGRYLALTGGTLTGPVTLAADPASALQPATKQYVDGRTGPFSAPELVPTSVKASAYTAAHGDLVPVDTTGGNVTVTLPSGLPTGSAIGVKMVATGSGHTVTVAASGSDVFNLSAGAVTLSLSLLNQGVVLRYGAAAGIWYVQVDDLPLAALDGRYSAGAAVLNVKSAPYNATGNGTSDDTAAITAALAAITAAGAGTVYFPPGTYATTGIVAHGMSQFSILADRGAVLTLLPNTVGSPNRASANALTIADCTDFTVRGLNVNGRRDTQMPLTALAANAASGQGSVQVAPGAAASYVVGQRLSVCGGLTANSGNDANLQDQGMTVQAIVPGTGGSNDVVTFTGNLANTYTFGGSVLSDAYGPYACNGAYITPWQTGNASVAGRALTQEDQQNGIHLINCQRFTVSDCNVYNLWESGIRCGTHNLTGSAQNDGCSQATISQNNIWHCYDQGVGLWCSAFVKVAKNNVNSAGWAGVCVTLGDDNVISQNYLNSNVQRIPGDTHAGYGVAIEGGARNNVMGNRMTDSYSSGIYLTTGGTLPFGGPAQLAGFVASGSNAVALPTATLNLVGIPTGWAGSGQCTVLSSAGAQQISYTGISGNALTGCSGGVGTLYTGQRVTQYPSFTSNGSALPPGSGSTTVSSGSLWQAGGRYSIVDGPRTERFDALSVVGTAVTLVKPTQFRHIDHCQISQAVCEDNVLLANVISGSGDAGIRLPGAVRTLVKANVINRSGLRGIDLVGWTGAGLQPPFGTVIEGNSIQSTDTSSDASGYEAIMLLQVSDVQVLGNRMTGAANTSGSCIALMLQGVTDCVVAENLVADAYAEGVRLDVMNEWVCKRVRVSGNVITRCLQEGIILYGGDSLVVSENTISSCASQNGPAGWGGGLDVRGLMNSRVSKNLVVNNGHGGINLDTATINGSTVYCVGNTFEGNISRDDGLNYDPWDSSHQTQGTGISELSSGQGPNTYLNNLCSGTGTLWNITSSGNTLRGNTGFNPVGKFSSQPAVPASTVAYTNVLNADATVFVAGGTVSAIAIGGQATGLTSGSFRVMAGQSITLTYSAAPSWVWFGD